MLVSDIKSDFTFGNFYNFVIRRTITSENLKYSLTNNAMVTLDSLGN